MRIPMVFVLALMVAGSCSDDAGDVQPPVTTTTTASTTSTTATTTTTTTTTSTTTTTTVPPGSMPVVQDWYTTDEMQVLLADSHVYLGGWIVDVENAWAVEQWGRGRADDASDWYAAGGEMEVWVSAFVQRTDDGTPVWNRTDTIVTTVRPEDGWEFSARCRVGGEPTDGVFAWYPPGSGADQWAPAVEAWRIDFVTGRAAPINAGVVDCENAWWGL